MKSKSEIATCCLMMLLVAIGCNQTTTAQQVNSRMPSSSGADTWVATDAFNRELPFGTTSTLKQDKFVGILYFLWHGARGYDKMRPALANRDVLKKLPSDQRSPYDITELKRNNKKQPAYGPVHAFHYWGKPLFGYYLANDSWVISKHAQMLSDAGVDVIVIDFSNGHVYENQLKNLLRIYAELRSRGRSTPFVTFLLNTRAKETFDKLNQEIFKNPEFRDICFKWKGKFLLLSPPLTLSSEQRIIFTLRHSWAWSHNQSWFGNGSNRWPWIDNYPQSYGWNKSPDIPEFVSVSVAGHPVYNKGRSYSNRVQPARVKSGHGIYFSEQWNRALQIDPEFILITGWNEWIAMRYVDGKYQQFLGKPIKKGDTYFVDLFDSEFSRDIEPVDGDYVDSYYYQMIGYIRKFKGHGAIKEVSEHKLIEVDGDYADWDSVQEVYIDDHFDIDHRNHEGWGRIDKYTNNRGINDIVLAKVATDPKHVYFYLKTRSGIQALAGRPWLTLFIQADDSKKKSNWEGFNFHVKRQANSSVMNIEKCRGGWSWEKVGTIKYKMAGAELELAIPKILLGLSGEDFSLNFKWTDDVDLNGNPLNWLNQGDCAPNSRFKYRFLKKSR